jgi:hypothetical protein
VFRLRIGARQGWGTAFSARAEAMLEKGDPKETITPPRSGDGAARAPAMPGAPATPATPAMSGRAWTGCAWDLSWDVRGASQGLARDVVGSEEAVASALTSPITIRSAAPGPDR